jgi:hypothetical protein
MEESLGGTGHYQGIDNPGNHGENHQKKNCCPKLTPH